MFERLKKKVVGGNIGIALGSLGLGIVVLFVSLFMIGTVGDATALSAGNASANESADLFYSTYTGLITTTGTVFSVGGLALIVAGLGMAIRTLIRAFKG